MPAGSTYEPIATTTLGSAQASVTFSSISGSYTDLVLVFAGNTTTDGGLLIEIGNGSVDTGSNYSTTTLYGTGSSAASYRRTSDNYVRLFEGTDTGTGQINSITQFQNYANTTTYKTTLTRCNSASNGTGASVSLWRSTSAINIIKISKASSTIASGSTFTLYGITAA